MEPGGSIGQTLRGRREERGLSMEQAAFRSRVPLRLIQILESDDYRLVPDAFYLIRCLHDYARLLGLDPVALEAGFQEGLRRPVRPSPVPAWAVPPPPSVSWRHLLWTVGGIIVVVPLVFIVLSLSSQREPAAPVPVAPAGEAASDARRAEEAALPETEEPGAEPAAGTTEPDGASNSSQPVADAGGAPEGAGGRGDDAQKRWRYVLTAEAHEKTWLAVTSDPGGSRQVLLQVGERARFVSDQGFLVTVGNAGGVTFSLNGAPLPMLGRPGEVVRNLPLPREDALPPSPGGAEARR